MTSSLLKGRKKSLEKMTTHQLFKLLISIVFCFSILYKYIREINTNSIYYMLETCLF